MIAVGSTSLRRLRRVGSSLIRAGKFHSFLMPDGGLRVFSTDTLTHKPFVKPFNKLHLVISHSLNDNVKRTLRLSRVEELADR